MQSISGKCVSRSLILGPDNLGKQAEEGGVTSNGGQQGSAARLGDEGDGAAMAALFTARARRQRAAEQLLCVG